MPEIGDEVLELLEMLKWNAFSGLNVWPRSNR
jgi:hypothetical protein